MIGNIRKLGARGMAIALITSALTMGTVVLVEAPASARCGGPGNRITSDFWVDGYKRVLEDPDVGTCNNNGTYSAVLDDVRADGRPVYVYFAYTSSPGNWYQAAATETAVHFAYHNPTNEAYQMFCINSPWTCGWGTNPSGRGHNWGF